MHSESQGQGVRIFVAKDWIALRVNGSTFQVPKKEFYKTLLECEQAVEDGIQLASLPIPSLEEKLKKPEPRKRRVVRAVNSRASRGVKIYLSVEETRWLGLVHGSPVEITPTTIDGENALILKAAAQV